MRGIERRDFVKWMGGGAAAATFGMARSLRGLPALPGLPTAPGRSGDWRLSDAFLSGLPERLRAATVPGIAIGLGGGDGPAAIHAAGRRAGPDSPPVSGDTVFMAASLSKPVLATVALALHLAGEFDLDRPISTYLVDDLPSGPGAGHVTPRLCLRHASGLPNWRFTAEPLELAFAPGSGWRYSGEGYVLVQRALERALGTTLERLARRSVFSPLGMDSTSYLALPRLAPRTAPPFVPPDERFADYAALAAWKERAVVEYAEETGRDPADVGQDELRSIDPAISDRAAGLAGRELPVPATVPNFLVPNGAGSLRTTAGDYLRFLAHWLGSRDLRSEAFAQPVPRDDGLAWGAGWGLEDAAGGADAAFWHWGETLGVRTLAYADPARDGALVILSNGDGGMDVAKAAFEDATGGGSPILAAL